MNRIKMLITSIIALLGAVELTAQQGNQYIFLDDISIEYIDYLYTTNRIQLEYPFQQPFVYSTVFDADISSEFFTTFKQYWSKSYNTADQFIMGLHLGHTVANTADPSSYRVESILGYSNSGFSAMNRTRIYENYKNDSLFAGDLTESNHWLYGRVNDAFIDYQSGHNHFFIGKLAHNWGPINTPSLVLSNNPYTYNKFLYDYTRNKFRVTTFFAPLETADGQYYNFMADSIEYYSNVRKYIVGHRLDLNLHERLKLAFTEIAIYGGPNRQVQFEFFNPMEFFYGIQRNDKVAMSGLWAVDLLVRPVPSTVVYMQLLLDDIIINNDPGVDDRARYPDRLGAYFSVRQGDFPIKGLLLDLSYRRMWNQTYQSLSSWENYHFHKMSLGYPHISSEEAQLKTQYWGRFPHFISSRVILGRYGAADVTDMFYLIKEDFPLNPVTYTFEHQLRYGWFNLPHLRLFLNHTFLNETLRDVSTTRNTFSIEIDYTFIR